MDRFCVFMWTFVEATTYMCIQYVLNEMLRFLCTRNKKKDKVFERMNFKTLVFIRKYIHITLLTTTRKI